MRQPSGGDIANRFRSGLATIQEGIGQMTEEDHLAGQGLRVVGALMADNAVEDLWKTTTFEINDGLTRPSGYDVQDSVRRYPEAYYWFIAHLLRRVGEDSTNS